MRLALISTLSLSILIAQGGAALHAAEPTATETLKARDAEIRAALPPQGKPVTNEVKNKLEALLVKIVDMEAMAKAALGKHWEAQTPAKRKEFLDTFVSAFRNAVGGQIDWYRNAATSFAAEQPKDSGVDVPATIVVKDEPTEIVYTMRKGDSGWRIVDITIDGVSTVENYRASFGKTIQKEGFDALIARLKKKPA